MESKKRILVYLQAIPRTVSSAATKFEDLSNSEFVLNHSSKIAIAEARRIFPDAEIIAAGYQSVLPEAFARGASKVISLPMCQDPLDQAKNLPATEKYACIVVGENPDGPFTGASLCGAIAALRKVEFSIGNKFTSGLNGILLLREDESASHNIDVRRICTAFEEKIAISEIRGNLSLGKKEVVSGSETVQGSPQEIASTLARRLRRLAVGSKRSG